MRPLLFATTAILLGSTASAAPDTLTRDDARHLLVRTGFGAAPAEIDAITGLSASAAVAQILADIRSAPSQPMPAWATGWLYPQDVAWTLGQTADELFFSNRYLEIEELSAWWLGEMIATPSPLTERLTLFWHDHFATSFESSENSQWMARQNAFFRAHAAGNFADLAHGILRDPAMLQYLSNDENFADHPNENLGREYLELFTLGEGRGYTEDDVKEAARALTGHSISDAGEFTFVPEDHDRGRKTILGDRGRHRADGLADVVLAHPEFGPYIVEKLWLTFVSPTPDAEEIARLTTVWKEADLELKPLLEALFLTEAFWDADNRGSLIKSPVDLVVGTIRTLGLEDVFLQELVYVAAEMGQHLFHPPNVAGWAGGTAWINDATAMIRATMLTHLAEGGAGRPDHMEETMMMMGTGDAPQTQAQTPEGYLRVGRVYGIWSELFDDEGLTALIKLFDISYGPDTWRSLTLAVEQEPAGALILASPAEDCAPICDDRTLKSMTGEDRWMGVIFADDWMEITAPIPDQAEALLQELLGHLPALFAQTEDHISWSLPEEYIEEEGLESASFEDIAPVIQALSDHGAQHFGAPEGALALAPSAPGLDGLGGLDQVRNLDMLDDYFEEAEAATARLSAPRHVYDTPRAWMRALPAPEDAARTLLAVPIPGAVEPGGSPRAVITSLLLSPAYQVK